MKSLTNCQNLSRHPFQGACSGFPIAACDSKSYSASRCDPEVVPKAGPECILERRKAGTEI
jgi:hypothetical protein